MIHTLYACVWCKQSRDKSKTLLDLAMKEEDKEKKEVKWEYREEVAMKKGPDIEEVFNKLTVKKQQQQTYGKWSQRHWPVNYRVNKNI